MLRIYSLPTLFALLLNASCGGDESSPDTDEQPQSTATGPQGMPGSSSGGPVGNPSPGNPAPGLSGTNPMNTGTATPLSPGSGEPTNNTPPSPTSTTDGSSQAGGGGAPPDGMPTGASGQAGTSAGGADGATGGTSAAGAGGDGGGAQSPGGSNTGGAAGEGGGEVECPSMSLAAGNSTRSIEVGGRTRSYELHVPNAYTGDQAVPLIVDFHPLGGSGPSEQSSSPYPSVVDGDGVIMAFPSGLAGPSGNAWNVGPCCVDDVDDVEFARALVDEVKSLACIDLKRVYAVGFSMGGGMSHYLACHAADIFAAVAPAAFDLLEENADTCDPPRPITVISFRGTSDFVVPYEGGYSDVVAGHPVNFLGAVSTMEKWAEINGCTGSASDLGDNCQGYTASQCEGGVEVTLCTQQGGSHAPGNANIAWPVLSRHVLP